MTEINESKEGVQVYELGYLLLPSIPEDSLSPVVDKLKGFIEKAGGKELESENPFKHDLAYTMTKVVGASRYVVNEAYIGWVKFEAAPESVTLLKEEVSKADEVLRSILIKTPRETSFTFAKAKALIEEKEAAERAPEEEASSSEETVVE